MRAGKPFVLPNGREGANDLFPEPCGDTGGAFVVPVPYARVREYTNLKRAFFSAFLNAKGDGNAREDIAQGIVHETSCKKPSASGKNSRRRKEDVFEEPRAEGGDVLKAP